MNIFRALVRSCWFGQRFSSMMKFQLFLCMILLHCCLTYEDIFMHILKLIFFQECHISVLRYLTWRNTWCYVCWSLYLWEFAPGLPLFPVWVSLGSFSFSCPLIQLNNILCPCLIPWMSPQLCVFSFSKVIFKHISSFTIFVFHVVDSHAELFKREKYSSIHGSFTIFMGKHVYMKIGGRKLSFCPFFFKKKKC